MKTVRRYKLLFLGLLLISFFVTLPVQALSVTVGEEQIKYQDETFELSLSIPVFYFDDWLQMDYLNSMIRFQQLRVAHEIANAAKELVDIHRYSVFSEFEVTYNEDNQLSLVTQIYQYTGGAHGMTAQISLNRNLATGKKLSLDNQYHEIILAEINNQIEQESEFYFESTFPVDHFDPESFYLTNDGIVVYYGLYEIAPYSSGIREFLIPWSLLR